MTQYGVFIYSEKGSWERPRSKTEISRTVPERICLEGTSPFDNLIPDGTTKSVNDLPVGSYSIVGPDPYSKRVFYTDLVIAENGQIFVK